jgi:hypothetical protein
MNEPNIEDINAKIFSFVKNNNEVELNNIYLEINENSYYTEQSLSLLFKEYQLITKSGSKIFLSEKGKKFKSYKKYLKSLKPKTEWFKIITISLTVVFGSLNLFQKHYYNSLKLKFDSLKKESVLLKSELDSLKLIVIDKNNTNVVNELMKPKQTLQTKNTSEK